jgi:rhodanese-related sulfurtransferase
MTTLDSADSASGISAGLTNLRDVGGLPTTDGRLTRSGVLYRSDVPLAGDALPVGLSWPPATVIDLRSEEESARAATPFTVSEAYHLPLLAAADPAKLHLPRDGSGTDGFMGRLYQEILRTAGAMMATLPTIGAKAPGPILVHCTAGRDRTGVAVAALLLSAGVTREAVRADYVATAANQAMLFPRLAAHGFFPKEAATPEAIARFGDTVEAIDGVLDVFDAHEGGARGWLVAQGADEAHLDAWTARIVEG